MRVSEVFYSIQGEGIYQGLPMGFIRLAGCNLTPKNCTYCDTPYAQRPDQGTDLSIECLLDKAYGEFKLLSKGDWVEVTGGEPLMQGSELAELVRRLKTLGYKVTIETNGSLPLPGWWRLVDSWNADIKCPTSGVCGTSLIEWLRGTRQEDQVKFVVGTMEDLRFVWGLLKDYPDAPPVKLISPVMDGMNIDREWLGEVVGFAKAYKMRVSLQLHKIIWGNRKGV